jgi:hypothetical protein
VCSAVIMRALDVGQSHWSASDLDSGQMSETVIHASLAATRNFRCAPDNRPSSEGPANSYAPKVGNACMAFYEAPGRPGMADNGFNSRFARAPKKPMAVELLRGVLRLASKSSISYVQYQRPRPYQPPPLSSTMRTTMMRSVVISICVFLQMLHIAQPGFLAF